MEDELKEDKPTPLAAGDLADLKAPAEAIDYLLAVPKTDYERISGRQVRTFHAQAKTYGIPLLGKSVDVLAVVRWLHDFLAENKHDLARMRRMRRMSEVAGEDEEDDKGFDYWSTDKLKEQTLKLRHERELREQKTLYRDDLAEVHGRWAERLRRLSEDLRRENPEAHRKLENALDDCERITRELTSGVDDDTDTEA